MMETASLLFLPGNPVNATRRPAARQITSKNNRPEEGQGLIFYSYLCRHQAILIHHCIVFVVICQSCLCCLL